MFDNPKILIIDDEPRMCQSIKELLASQKYELDTANSAKEAIDFLNNNCFDLVLLDLCLVITSYSIHYTKLYDILMASFILEKIRPAVLFSLTECVNLVHQFVVFFFPPNDLKKRRILQIGECIFPLSVYSGKQMLPFR